MAKKSLEDLLSENKDKPGVKETAKRQAIFLAYWEQIEEAYKKGWNYRDIWFALHMEGIFEFGYSTFLHYKDKKKRRTLEIERQKAREEGALAEPMGGSVEPLKAPPTRTPGSNKVEMPTFGQSGVKREPKRF